VATAASRFAPGVPRDPSSFPGAFAYEQTDVPPGRTLSEYRHELALGRRPRHGLLAFIRSLASRHLR
jgi:hypothetical protein